MWLKEQAALEEAELAAQEKQNELANTPVLSSKEEVEKQDNESDNEEEGEEDCKEKSNVDAAKDEHFAGVRMKNKKQTQKKPVVQKLTSKQRRRMERSGKEKKIGVHYYKEVDVKMKRTKF